MEIAPSLLSADFSNLVKDIKICESSGAKVLHIDVMDGHFVPNITIGPVVISSLRKKSRMIFDTHLMISEPEKYIEPFARAGSDWLTFHIEAVKEPVRVIKKVKALGLKAGISLNPATPVSKIRRYLDYVDLVLVMSVNPGFGGQKFMPEVLSKVRELKKEKNKLKISVDGGINFDTIRDVARAGADIAVAGYSVFRTGNDIGRNIKKLKELSDTAKED